MFHGPLIPGKGLEVLIDAMSLLKRTKIRLKIVGTGQPDYVDSLRRRALTREVMDMIDWHKHTKRPLDIIGGCHFGVLPSVKEEAFGLANLEYMASGRPRHHSQRRAEGIPHRRPRGISGAGIRRRGSRRRDAPSRFRPRAAHAHGRSRPRHIPRHPRLAPHPAPHQESLRTLNRPLTDNNSGA